MQIGCRRERFSALCVNPKARKCANIDGLYMPLDAPVVTMKGRNECIRLSRNHKLIQLWIDALCFRARARAQRSGARHRNRIGPL
jgi:hypothetical protein